ncbi:MAG: hypothetical protein ABF308_04080 [Phaeobacter gallaeciensis]
MDPTRFDFLLNRYLDAELSSDEKNELQTVLLSDPEARQQFWLDARLHGSLRLLAEQESGAHEALSDVEKPGRNRVGHARQRIWFGAAASAAVAALVLFVGLLLTRPLDASAALQQVIEAASQTGDRTYTVSVLKGDPVRPISGGRSLTLEGAIVYLRGSDRYVVVQNLTDGTRRRTTGFDGEQSWSFIGSGAVNVSDDPRRFRSNLPGSRHDFAFTNLHDELVSLRDGYDVQLRDADDSGLRRLSAFKRSRTVRGPREVEIWFDPVSGTIRKLELYGLPQGRGGPRAICLSLTDQRDLGADFFSHTAHHEAGRKIRTESSK